MLSSLAACGEQGEPELPAFDPMDKIDIGPQGYRIKGTIAVNAKNEFYHMQHLISGYHNFDLETPPVSVTPVEPSCNMRNLAGDTQVHVIVAPNYDSPALTKEDQITSLSVSQNWVDEESDRRKKKFEKTGKASGRKQPSSMRIRNVVVTEPSRPVFIVVTSRYPTIYNFTVAPYADVEGVMFYSQSEQAAISGLSPEIPVYFQSEEHPNTESCWKRVENKPDETWREHKEAMRLKSASSQKNSRYHLLKPIFSTFAKKVRDDVGYFNDDTLINVGGASYFLIGPAPTMIEQRLPYSPIAGSNVSFMASEHITFGTRKENKRFAENVIAQNTEELIRGK